MNQFDSFDIASIVKWKSDNPAHPTGMVHHPYEKLKKSIRNDYTLKKYNKVLETTVKLP